MNLVEYLKHRGNELPVEQSITLWRIAAVRLREICDQGRFHNRLQLRSFAIDPDEGPESLQITDTGNIVASGHTRTAGEEHVWSMAAPEQTGLVAESPGCHSNVYNLGVLGFYLLTGQFPFEATPQDTLAEAIVRREPPISEFAGLNPPRKRLLRSIVARAMQKRPSDRYAEIEYLEAELAVLQFDEPDGDGAGRVPLVGRERIQQEIVALVDRVRAGSSEALLLLGEAGIGKSFLWHAIEASSELPDEKWVYFKSPQTGEIPYAGLAVLLDQLLSALSSKESDIQDHEGWKLSTLLERHGVTDRGRYMAATILPRAAELFRIDRAEARTRVGTGSDDTVDELASLILALAECYKATTIAVDDIQWADQQTMAVLRRLIESDHSGTLLALIGRAEAKERIPETTRIVRYDLPGLSDDASYRLLNHLLSPTPSEMEVHSVNERIRLRAQGNPLAIVNLLQGLRKRQSEVGASDLLGDSIGEFAEADLVQPESDLLTELAHGRLQSISGECRRLLRYISLLLPPVGFPLLERIPGMEGDALERLLDESVEALLLQRDTVRRQVWFTHDSIESRARDEALRDTTLVSSAARILFGAAQHGDDRASFALARLLTGRGVEDDGRPPVRDYLQRAEAVEILYRAASRALELVIPSDALHFAEAALTVEAERGSATDRDDELVLNLHRIAHEAAFLLDDAYLMSRHFRKLHALGDRLDVNRARQFWITRAYAKSWFSGATRIAWVVFRELQAVPETAQVDAINEQATRFLRHNGPRSLYKRLVRRRRATDTRTELVIKTCLRVLLPVLNVRREMLPIVVYLILTESLSGGRTDYTGIAYIFWGVFEALRDAPGRRLHRLWKYAQDLAARTDDRIARHTIRCYANVFIMLSPQSYARAMDELKAMYEEGIRIANFEFAVHAAHIYTQSLLHRGMPLDEVFRTFGEYRERMIELNFYRSAHALAKFQQAAESLMGRTPDPFALTGSIVDEDEYWRAITRDQDVLSIVCFRLLKALLAIYGDEPGIALHHLRRATEGMEAVTSLYDISVIVFLLGMAAFREGAEEEGRDALVRLRRWTRDVRENHEHRYLAVLAERAAAEGKRRRAARRYERSRRWALERGYPHEAALIAERHGDLLQGDPSSAPRATEPLHIAQSLYTQWGAVLAADRVRKKLSWTESPSVISPVLADQRFLARITAASTESELLNIALKQLSRFSAAAEAYLVADIEGGRRVLTQQWRGSGLGEVDRMSWDRLDPAIAAHIEQCEPGASVVDGPSRERGDRRALLLSRTDPSPNIRLTICLGARQDAPAFSAFVAARVSGTLLLTGSLLQLRETIDAAERQADELSAAREELLRTQEYSQLLFGSLPNALLLLDDELNVLFHNPASTRYFIRSDQYPPSLDPQVLDIIRLALKQPEDTAQGEIDAPWQGRVLRVLRRPAMPGSSREPSGISAVSIQDVTELTQQSEALRRQEQQLIVADRMASIGMFSSAIAHEVSNPNHILLLNAQSLFVMLEQWRAQGGTTDPASLAEAERLIEQVVEGAQRIESVVQQVKEYGRGGRTEEWESVEPNELCERALRFSRIMAAKFTKHLSFDRSSSGPPVVVMRGLIEQAIINLIKNACEALRDPSGEVKVRVQYSADGSEACISVADTGPGIDPDVASRLGQPFASARAGEGGTGLGLSIVQTILERHGGRLAFRTREHYNTVAEIYLPVAEHALAGRAGAPDRDRREET